MLAEAVLEVASLTRSAARIDAKVNPGALHPSFMDASDEAVAPASPVEKAREPRAIPPPNRKTVPQSMRAACLHSRANRDAPRSSGTRKRTLAATRAAGPSPTRSERR